MVWLTALFCLHAVAAASENISTIVWELEIQGEKAFSEGDLKDAIATQSSSHIPFIGAKREFDAVQFQADLKRIEHFYKRNGYYQAFVERADVVPCSDEGRVCITTSVVEGEPTRLGRVALNVHQRQAQAENQVSDAELTTIFGMSVGEIFDHDRYTKQKEVLEMSLKERHFPFPKIEGRAEYIQTNNVISLDLDVRPGTAARLGYISFDGLDKVLPEDARARLPIKTGEAYDPSLMEDATALLADLDVFGSIDVDLQPRRNDPSIIDVIFRVREKPLKTLQFGAGVGIENSRQEARGRAEWSDRNFYNRLRQFTVRAEPRYAVLPSIFRPDQKGPLGTIETTLRYPSFFGARQSLRTAIGFDSDLEQGYHWYGPRTSALVDRRVNRYVTVSGGYAFRYLTFYDVRLIEGGSSRLVPTALLFNRNYRLGYLTQRVSWDRRDYPIEPHSGAYADLALSESAHFLGSAFKYFRFEPEARYYIPMTKRATLATKIGYGQIFLIGNSTSPITERFYGGGANSHRGFTYHRLSPGARAVDGRLVPVGGNASFLASAEPRINMFTLGGQWLIGALFIDAGDVTDFPSQLDLTRLHVAVGGGIRYQTPVGVIRGDVGVRLNRLENMTGGLENPDPGRRFAFHVSLGEAF